MIPTHFTSTEINKNGARLQGNCGDTCGPPMYLLVNSHTFPIVTHQFNWQMCWKYKSWENLFFYGFGISKHKKIKQALPSSFSLPWSVLITDKSQPKRERWRRWSLWFGTTRWNVERSCNHARWISTVGSTESTGKPKPFRWSASWIQDRN